MKRMIHLLSWAASCALLGWATAAGQAAPPQEFSPEQVRTGAELYERYCANCHGVRMEGVDPLYDLRKFSGDDRPRFFGAVLSGIRTMPPWSGLLTLQQIEALWAYTMSRKAGAPADGVAGPVKAPASAADQAWPCGGDPRLLLDSTGVPVWISSEELRNRGIRMPPPTRPSSAGAVGKLTVDVLVDSQGRVTCSRVADGPADLKSALTEAVAKWTFQPFSADGRPVAVFGRLEFVFDHSK